MSSQKGGIIKVSIIHFSDIHLKSESNIIFDRKNEIVKALQNELSEIEKVFIVNFF